MDKFDPPVPRDKMFDYESRIDSAKIDVQSVALERVQMLEEDLRAGLGGEESHPPLSEQEVCEAINRWSSQGYFRLRYMGDKIFIDEVRRGVAYTLRLQTHYEHRTVQRVSVPFHGGSVDDRGRPPAPWEMQVNRPAAFEERTDVVAIPHTERVQMCSACAGEGRVHCSQCQGSGRTACPWCGGAGFRERQILQSARDAAGNVTTVPQTVREACSCAGGTVLCGRCHGNRVVTCSTCAGSGSVKTFDQLVVRFQTAAQGELLDVTPVPDRWLAKLPGTILIDERAPRIERAADLPEAAANKARELLAASHDVDPHDYRLLLQHLHVERIPIHEVQYKYAGTERVLWICGNNQEVYAPKAPWNRSRLFGLITVGVLAIAAIAGILIWQLT